MPVVLCQNFTYDRGGKRWRCRRFLGELTDEQVQSLRDNPGKASKFRCPKCPQEFRYSKVFFENGKMKWRHCEPEEVPQINNNWLEFDDIEACEPVK